MTNGHAPDATGRAYPARWTESTGTQLLVVDPATDDGALGEALWGRGVHVTWVPSTLEGLVAFGRIAPQAVVVAPEAPGIPVPEFVGLIREHGSPYVMGAAASSDQLGPVLLAGAAGVVPRPYDAEELCRLLDRAPRPLTDHARLTVGPLELDAGAFTVHVGGARISDLPLKEFELLRALMLAAPGVVTDEELRQALWGEQGRRPRGNTIAMHVARLRARLRDVAVVRRVRGRGYSLVVDPTELTRG